MAHRYWADRVLRICGQDVSASIEFDFTPARSAHTPRGEYAPIDPPEPAIVDIVKVELHLRDETIVAPSWLRSLVQEDDFLYDQLVEVAETYES